jgi:hypothetical protein
MNKNSYDIIIIGSGIAGLYSAYNIMKYSPTTSFIILEKYKKKWIGGRWGNEDFHGTTIVTGAGIGRKKKDKLLLNLMKDLHVPIHESISQVHYAISDPVDVKKIMNYLRSEYKKYERKPRSTFEHFANLYLDDKVYKKFLETAGYTDFEKEDVYDVLYNYGMEDNVGNYISINVPWKEMIEKLTTQIGIDKIKTSSNVVKIEKIRLSPCMFHIIVENGLDYFCNKVIIATTIDGIMKLVPNANTLGSPYKEIHGQTFLRLYGQFSKSSIPILKHFVPVYTIVSGPLQKIIPIDADSGVYMIAYSDNKSAIYLKKYLENTEKNKEFLCLLIEKSLGIHKNTLHLLDIKDFYWPIGTHYYSPLSSTFKNRSEFINKITEKIKEDPSILDHIPDKPNDSKIFINNSSSSTDTFNSSIKKKRGRPARSKEIINPIETIKTASNKFSNLSMSV